MPQDAPVKMQEGKPEEMLTPPPTPENPVGTPAGNVAPPASGKWKPSKTVGIAASLLLVAGIFAYHAVWKSPDPAPEPQSAAPAIDNASETTRMAEESERQKREVEQLRQIKSLQTKNELLEAELREKGQPEQKAHSAANRSQPIAVTTAQAPSPGRTLTEYVTGMEFVWVPGGSFEMGCGPWTSDCYDDEKPVKSVQFSGFWLGKFEVTQGQWQRVMGSNPSHSKKGDNYPVENVSWDDAKAFISKLNAQGSAKFRLPTEAEWEYAARSGGKPEKYAGGDLLGRVAWYDGNSDQSTHSVGTKAPNGLGLYDMSGNVWEWCEDGCYPASQDTAAAAGRYHLVRGGGWLSTQRHVRTTCRDCAVHDDRSLLRGFRLAMTN